MDLWHTETGEEILKRQGSDLERGLPGEEVRRRQESYGPNRLTEKKGDSLLIRLGRQFKDPMILTLLGAAVVAQVASGGRDWLDTIMILIILIINAVISLHQEGDAQRALAALRDMAAPHAKVVREGKPLEIEASELVPGDILLLEAGDLVPADARILTASGLCCDESALTGESQPVTKTGEGPLLTGTPLAERRNMVWSSTTVTRGRARCVVVETGMNTQVGKIAGLLLGQKTEQTPLQQKMGEISKALSFLCLCVCAVMFGIGLLQGKELLDMLLTAVSLAVAAIPEGLCAIVTIVLALGVQRMAKRGAIVKALTAVETLGCAGVVCSDKTGTLTQNRMTVKTVWTFGDKWRKDALAAAALCSDGTLTVNQRGRPTVTGDPTEAAIVLAAAQEGLDKNELEAVFPRRGENPFDSERKRMSTLHPTAEGGWRVLCKGATDVLLARCTHCFTQEGTVPMTGRLKQRILRQNQAMAEEALRVLAVAWKEGGGPPPEPGQMEEDLTFVGLIGMIDPPRAEAKTAVDKCRKAGIRPVMITGDHKATAVAIAKELGLYREGDLALTGSDLDFMPQSALEDTVEKCSVYARVSPEHKTRIVSAWKAKGQVVAMTGDGVNDAPALKGAHIGCAMGKGGTDVAKEAADLILTDDNFATIVSAVEEGRGIYANIKKAVHYLLSCNIGEILTIFIATVLDFAAMPLLPIQLLWLNLVTDSLPALALGVEPVEAGVMEQPPRNSKESIFNRSFTLRLLWQGAMVGILTLGAYILGETVLMHGQVGVGTTMAFGTLTLCQLCHAFDARSETKSLFSLGFFTNKAMNKAFFVGLTLQLAVLCFPPLMGIFGTVPMDVGQWMAVLSLAITPVVVCEIGKKISSLIRGG